MDSQIKGPILIVGLGGVGSKLAINAKEIIDADCLLISNDIKDLSLDIPHVQISTEHIVNPTAQLIKSATYKVADEIKRKVKNYATVILMGNLAGKTGAALTPIVSELCRNVNNKVISFVVMPFKFEKDRIFNSGISLKRVKENSEFTIVLDNNALLENNPDLNIEKCNDIANSAIMHIIKSISTLEMSTRTNILATSRSRKNIEDSFKDSLKMVYENATPNTIKHSILYVIGGDKIPLRLLDSISNLMNGILDKTSIQVDTSLISNESRTTILASVQKMTKFDNYDPLAIIPMKDTLDWNVPECSVNYESNLYQLEQ